MVGGGMKKLSQSGHPMSEVLPKAAIWIKDKAVTFFPEENRLITASGQEVHYQYLVLALGLQLDFNKVSIFLHLLFPYFLVHYLFSDVVDQGFTRSIQHSGCLLQLLAFIR